MSEPRCRILRCITRLNVGGPTFHVMQLLRGLSSSFEQLLVSGPVPEEEGAAPGSLPCSHVEIPNLVRGIRPWADRRAYQRLREVIRDFRPHIVHTHQGKAGALARLAAHREGVASIIHTYHGNTFKGYFGPVVGRMILNMERNAARRSHVLICQSPTEAAVVERTLGASARGKVVVIPPAVPLDRFFSGSARGPSVRSELGVSPHERLVVVPARLVRIKNLERAVAWAAAAPRQWPVQMVIAGGGPEEGRLRRLVTQTGAPVRLLGWYRDMPGLLGAADLVLLTSRSEGTPLSLLEGLASGAQVAAPDVGGVRDLLGSFGTVLSAGGTVADWWAALEEALQAGRRTGRDREIVNGWLTQRHGTHSLVGGVRDLYLRRGALLAGGGAAGRGVESPIST